MKLLALIALFLLSSHLWSLTLEDINNLQSQVLQKSTRPANAEAIREHASNTWLTANEQPQNNFEANTLTPSCKLKVPYYSIQSVDFSAPPQLDLDFYSIRTKADGNVIAYKSAFTIVYELSYSYAETLEDETSSVFRSEVVSCRIPTGDFLFYENTIDGSVNYLGLQ